MADETQQNNAHERIQKLRDEIEHHSYLYYVKDAGGILGGWLVSLFGWVPTGTWGTFLASIIGAIVLLWIVSLFTRHKPAKTM